MSASERVAGSPWPVSMWEMLICSVWPWEMDAG